MDPLITHLCERARHNDPRLRHVSLRSLPLLEVTNEEMYAVVESLQYNTHVTTFDVSIHHHNNRVADFDREDDDDENRAENNHTNNNNDINPMPRRHHHLDNDAVAPLAPLSHPTPPPFEVIFARNTSLVDVRISSSSSSILAAVFRGLALNSSVQILQVGEMSAMGPTDTTNMDLPCSVELERLLQINHTIHRLALQGFHWSDPMALEHVAHGLRHANKNLRVLELLQIITTTTTPTTTTVAAAAADNASNNNATDASTSETETTTENNATTTNATATTRQLATELANTNSNANSNTNLMAAISAMKYLKRLSIIACEMEDVSFSNCNSENNPDDNNHSDAGMNIRDTIVDEPFNMDIDIPMISRLDKKNNTANNSTNNNHQYTDLIQLQKPTLNTNSNCCTKGSNNNSNQPQLEELRLVECELTGPSIHSLHRGWKHNPFLRILDVRGNSLEDNSCFALAEILNTATSLTKVILEDNNIGDQGLAALCRNGLDQNKTLEQLCLKDNNFGPRGVEALADALKCNTSLLQVDLSYNFVGDDGATALGQVMLRSNTTLQDLILENTTIGGVGISGLCSGLGSNRTLQKLNLSGNAFGSTGIRTLARLLAAKESNEFRSSLVSLRLASCQLGDGGVSALAQALEHNTSMLEIVLPFNRFGDEGAKVIGQSLPNWRGLESLQIQFNLFSEAGFANIVQGLSKNFYLKSMYLLNAGPSSRRIDNLFQEMQYWIRLNKGGRRALNEQQTMFPSLWPLVLSQASRAYSADAIYFLLREIPEIVPASTTDSGRISRSGSNLVLDINSE